MRVTAIDIGTNSIHTLAAEVSPEGKLIPLEKLKERARLGETTLLTGDLPTEAIDRTIATLKLCREMAIRTHSEHLLAYATSAVRDAKNKNLFRQRVYEETKITIRVISGEEEARLIWLGARHILGASPGRSLLVDVGGGSAEFILAEGSQLLHGVSLPLGVLRLAQRFCGPDRLTEENLTSMIAEIDLHLAPLARELTQHPIQTVAFSSGTASALAELCALWHGGPESLLGAMLRRTDLQALSRELLYTTALERSLLPGLPAKRLDTLVPGLVLFNRIFQLFDLQQGTYCSPALREGMIVDLFEKLYTPEDLSR